MSVTLTTGLADLSRELGETTTNTTTDRINHYNDAVVALFNAKKWPFALKKDTTQTTTSGTNTYTIPVSDWRTPGGIKYIMLGSTVYKPIDWEEREEDKFDGGEYFYINPEGTQITFLKDVTTTGTTITYYYFAIATRQVAGGTFSLLPDRYRKAVAYLAASFVLRGRHMNGEANDRFKLYQLEIQDASLQQSERTSNLPRSFGHYLKFRGFARRYP